MLRLVDEIVQNSSYIDSRNVDYIDCVGLSEDAYAKIVKEIKKELNQEFISHDDIEQALTLKFNLIPNSYGIEYEFYKIIRP